MTFKKIALLAFLVGILSLFVFQVEMPRIEQERTGKIFLGGIDPAKLERVEVKRRGDGFTIVNGHASPEVTSKPGKDSLENSYQSQILWSLEGNKEAMLDAGSVDGLVNALADLELGDPIPKEDVEGDWGVYGLT